MALNYTFEFLFDSGKAEHEIEGIAKKFVDAFNKGKPMKASESEFARFFDYTKTRLDELNAEYEKTRRAIIEQKGNPENDPTLKTIERQIEGVKRLRTESQKAYQEIGSSRKIDLTAAFQSGRSFDGSTSALKKAILDTKELIKELDAQLKDTERELQKLGMDPKNSAVFEKIKNQSAEAKAELAGLEAALRSRSGQTPPMAKDLNEIFQAALQFKGGKGAIREAINETKTEILTLRTQYSDLVSELESRGEDTAGNPHLEKMKIQIDELEARYKGLMQLFKNKRGESENIFAGVAQGASGLMGAFTAAQGAAALFGAEEEKLAKIQTKLQASMSILMGLQRAGNLLNSQSQFRIQVINKLLAKYHAWNLKVAESEGIKKAAMAGVVGIIVATIALITKLIISYSKFAKEVEIAKEAQKSFMSEFASSASSELATLNKLQVGWKNTNGDIKKQQKYISQNKSELESLGITATNTKKVEEQLFSEEARDRIMQKARAAAYLAQITSMLTKQMELQAKIENENNRPKTWWESFALTDYAIQEKKDKNIAKWQQEIDKYQKEIDAVQQKYADETWTMEDDAANKKYEQGIASRREAARKGYESILRLNEDMENKLAEQRNAAIMNATERELATLKQSHDRRIQEIERERKDYEEKLREQAKLEYKASNPNAEDGDVEAYGRRWKPTSEQKSWIDEYYAELAQLEEEAYRRSQKDLYAKLQESKWEYWKEYGSVDNKVKAIIESYQHQIDEAVDNKDVFKAISLTAKRDEELWQTRNASRLQYLEQYGTIEEKEIALTEKYQHEMLKLTDDYAKKLRTKQYEQDKFMLERQKGGKFYNIFRDTDRMNIVQIADAIKLAEEQIKTLSEDADANAERIEAFKSALENLKKAANDFSLTGLLRSIFSSDKDDPTQKASLSERIAKLREQWASMGEDAKAKAVGGWASGIANSLQKAAGYMRQIAEASGDPRIGKAAGQLESVAQNFSAAGQGAASGGWVGAVVAGVLDIFGQISEGLVGAKVQEIQATKYAEDWRDALEGVVYQMREAEYYSPFGERAIAKAREGARVATATLDGYKNKLKELEEYYSSYEYKMGAAQQFLPVDARNISDMLRTGKGLSSAAVVTRHRTWGKDEYSTLEELYPELFKDGELVVENIKKLLESESYLNDEQNEKLRKQLENLVKLKEEYDSALKAIDDAISDTFSEISSDITDIIWDSVMNGTDAWEEFQKVGSEAITKLGKQLIQEMVISTYLDQFRERMEKAYMLDTPQEQQNELRNITAEIFNGLHGVFDATSQVAQDWKDWAEQEGFDLAEAKERNAVSKAISGVSQETFNEMSGRVTSIQLSAYNIDETTRTVREQQVNLLAVTSQILYEVQGIHSDTARMQESLDSMQGDMAIVKSSVGTMADKGVRLLN